MRETNAGGSAFFVSDITAKAKMDQNEAPFDLPARFKDNILSDVRKGKWNHYPQPVAYRRLKERFARQVQLKPDELFFGAGEDQVILAVFLLARQLYGARANVLIFEPTYPVFRHYAKILQMDYDRVILGSDYRIMKKHIRKKYDLVIAVSPNNPTGQLIGADMLTAICERYPRSLVLIDEAYHQFAGVDHRAYYRRYPNVILGRSFSKVQLAGLRIGYGIARPEQVRTMEYLLGVPYNLNLLQLAVIRRYHELKREITMVARKVDAEKQRFYAFFSEQGIAYQRSAANYILFATPDPDTIYQQLLDASVKVRNVSWLPGLAGWLRVTVRSRSENNRFFRTLKKLC